MKTNSEKVAFRNQFVGYVTVVYIELDSQLQHSNKDYESSASDLQTIEAKLNHVRLLRYKKF